MRANMVTTLTDKAPSVLLLCCPRLYGKTLYDEMDKPNQYVDEEDSEEEVVARLNKMVAKYKLHGKDDLDPADLPVNLQYAASHIKFHKVGYRPRLVTTENEAGFRFQERIVRIDLDLENQA